MTRTACRTRMDTEATQCVESMISPWTILNTPDDKPSRRRGRYEINKLRYGLIGRKTAPHDLPCSSRRPPRIVKRTLRFRGLPHRGAERIRIRVNDSGQRAVVLPAVNRVSDNMSRLICCTMHYTVVRFCLCDRI